MRMTNTKGMWWTPLIYAVILITAVVFVKKCVEIFSSQNEVSPDSNIKTDSPPPTQKERQTTIQKLCRSHLYQDPSYVQEDPMGLQYYAIRSGLFQSVWVDEGRQLLFCKVHKVASTVWRTALVKSSPLASASLRDTSFATEHTMQQAGLRALGLMTLPEVMYRLKYFRKVIFVRHPLKRILSAYRDRLLSPLPDRSVGQRILQYLHPEVNITSMTSQRNITFEGFIRYVIMTMTRGMPDPHWASFSSTCLPCLVNYDFIGKLETSSQDFAYVIKRYANATSFPGNLHGPSSRDQHKTTNDVFREYYKQLPVELLHQLVDLYRTDFALFGYDKNDPLNA